MSHVLVGLYRSEAQAKNAMNALVANGIQEDYIRSSPESMVEDTEQDTDSDGGITGFFRSLFGGDDHMAHVYSDAVNQGNTMVTVEVDDEVKNQKAIEILNQFNPIDIEDSVTSGTARAGTAAAAIGTSGPTADSLAQGARIPVIQEKIAIGKREVQRGGVRIVQRVSETPVQESVQLREEHVSVERRPVNQPISSADVDALTDQTFELTETSQEAIVSKRARVVEEVVVGKDVTERTETVNDTIRRTDVEVEQIDSKKPGAKKRKPR